MKVTGAEGGSGGEGGMSLVNLGRSVSPLTASVLIYISMVRHSGLLEVLVVALALMTASV